MIIKNKSNNKIIANNAWTCETLNERCRGLMFKKLKENEGCVLVNSREGILESGIHMMFVPQKLQVIFADDDLKVIQVMNCKKAGILNWWRTYFPKEPAKYVIEVLNAKRTIKGDQLQFIK